MPAYHVYFVFTKTAAVYLGTITLDFVTFASFTKSSLPSACETDKQNKLVEFTTTNLQTGDKTNLNRMQIHGRGIEGQTALNRFILGIKYDQNTRIAGQNEKEVEGKDKPVSEKEVFLWER